ncbi:MAG TPA: CDP-alcohol phosphatidyltransferase family protein [Gemmatimonadaceae bacterium]|nr:CDP-alcohol phosphatidyltransferase family protein [Gemmatimonadaceae bacterium]
MSSSRILTVPNLLSLSRLPLAAAFLLVEGRAARVALVGLASLTDFLDGWLARRGQTSQLGALLDPIADKTFVLVAILAFLIEGAVTAGEFMIVISRDLATAVGFIVAYLLPGLDPRAFKARWPGKVVTVLQLAALFALLLRPAVFPALVVLIALASAWAIADYTLVLHRQRVRS